jgi:tetratricopeptide (TPR) repeat protein
MRTRAGWFIAFIFITPALFGAGGGGSGGGGDSGGGGGGGGKAVETSSVPATAQSWYDLGYKAARSEKYDEALKDFGEALKLRPDYPEALNMEGYSLRKSGKPTEAFAYYDKALALRPDFPDAREYYGEASLQTGDLKKAVQQYLILEKAKVPQAKELLAWIDAYVNGKTPPAEDL